jgi:hypothetical protein
MRLCACEFSGKEKARVITGDAEIELGGCGNLNNCNQYVNKNFAASVDSHFTPRLQPGETRTKMFRLRLRAGASPPS